MFDTKLDRISLNDLNGNAVHLKIYGEPVRKNFSDVYYPAYYIIPPHFYRDIEIDMGNFETHSGIYQYKFSPEYYYCSTIVQDTKQNARINLSTLSSDMRGRLVVP